MNKKLIFILVILVSLLITIPAGAAWNEKITGGTSFTTMGAFTITLSAWENADGSFGGQGQYYYPGNGNTFHLVVEKLCSGTVLYGGLSGQPYVVAIGPIKDQDGTEMWGDYGLIAIAEGDDAGDGFRVLVGSKSSMEYQCTKGANWTYSPRVIDGNFNIRSK
ncbi:MAG: hypothetical protein ABFS32_23035 [Bacteroidota bacterium]